MIYVFMTVLVGYYLISFIEQNWGMVSTGKDSGITEQETCDHKEAYMFHTG